MDMDMDMDMEIHNPPPPNFICAHPEILKNLGCARRKNKLALYPPIFSFLPLLALSTPRFFPKMIFLEKMLAGGVARERKEKMLAGGWENQSGGRELVKKTKGSFKFLFYI